jgi:Glycosyl transferase family 2
MDKFASLCLFFLILLFLVTIQVVLIGYNERISRGLSFYKRNQENENDITVDYGRVALCSVAKSESAYLDEWTDYYLSIGFDRIYIYDNNEQYVLGNWLEKSNKSESVSVTFFPGEKMQRIAYADCAKKVRQSNFSWVLFVDIDEFLVLKRHERVDKFLSEYCSDGALAVNWRVFGTSGHLLYKPVPVLKRFQMRLPDDEPLNLFVKSFVRTSSMKVLPKFYRSPHVFPIKEYSNHWDTNGTIVNSSLHKGPTDVAVIHHYKYKSYEEFYKNKIPRGSAFYGGRKKGVEYIWDPLPNGSIFDDIAWKNFLAKVPRYTFFE